MSEIKPIGDEELAEIVLHKGLTEAEPGCLYPLDRWQALAIIARLRAAEAERDRLRTAPLLYLAPREAWDAAIEAAAVRVARIEPDADAAECDPTWGDFVDVAQAAIRSLTPPKDEPA